MQWSGETEKWQLTCTVYPTEKYRYALTLTGHLWKRKFVSLAIGSTTLIFMA